MNNQLQKLKKEYMNAPIPEELDFTVQKAIKEGVWFSRRKKWGFHKIKVTAASVAAAFLIMIAGANSSMAFAAALSKIPVVGDIINVLTFREYRIDEKTYDSHIKVPEIKGLENKDLENSLNKKYLDEGKQLYEDFIADMGNLKENGGGHLGVHSGYTVVTDNDRILSISRYTVNTVASSSTTMKYDTIDKVNEVLVTLPSLFKDDSYVNIISENIKEQMVDENESDPNKVYWVKGIEQSSLIDLFEEISQDQNFYINSENKLVISFDKYEVAPGYMGIVEFVIPTEILSELLVGDAYIK